MENKNNTATAAADGEDEDEEIEDDIPKGNRNLPKTHDLMNAFANPLAVITVSMMGLGIKEMISKRTKKDDEEQANQILK